MVKFIDEKAYDFLFFYFFHFFLICEKKEAH